MPPLPRDLPFFCTERTRGNDGRGSATGRRAGRGRKLGAGRAAGRRGLRADPVDDDARSCTRWSSDLSLESEFSVEFGGRVSVNEPRPANRVLAARSRCTPASASSSRFWSFSSALRCFQALYFRRPFIIFRGSLSPLASKSLSCSESSTGAFCTCGGLVTVDAAPAELSDASPPLSPELSSLANTVKCGSGGPRSTTCRLGPLQSFGTAVVWREGGAPRGERDLPSRWRQFSW